MKVVILCGGKGTRSYPFTEYAPKVMMPVNGSPVLVDLMRSFASQGFSDFVLAAGYRQEVLHDYFAHRNSGWRVKIVDTGDEADTGERVFRCADYIGDRFLATYGDGLGDVDLHALVRCHEQSGAFATLTTVPLCLQYGLVVSHPNGLVEQFLEKPRLPGYWINAGFFVFDREVFSMWEGRSLEREVLVNLAARRALNAYRHSGFWKSMDTSKDLHELNALSLEGTPPWIRVQCTGRQCAAE